MEMDEEEFIMSMILTHTDIHQRAVQMAKCIQCDWEKSGLWKAGAPKVFPVPRGGVPVAYLLKSVLPIIEIVSHHEEAHIIVDDLIDSGATRDRFNGKPFYALYNKQSELDLGWLVFPWEGSPSNSIEDNVLRVLQYIGEDPNREGLLETPARVVKSWKELFAGYQMNVEDVFKTFAVKYNELVIMQDIEMWSTCEHHMLPFFGRAHVAYIADGKVIGASKLARLVEVFSRRLQIQEQIGTQVVDALMIHLQPKGAACILEARHLCMSARGVSKQHSIMKTSAMRGVFLEDSQTGIAARAELMSLLR
jgi:GTP cyclohydrolase IA